MSMNPVWDNSALQVRVRMCRYEEELDVASDMDPNACCLTYPTDMT